MKNIKEYSLYSLYPYLYAGIVCLFLLIINIIIIVYSISIIIDNIIETWYSYSFGFVLLLLLIFFFFYYYSSKKRNLCVTDKEIYFVNLFNNIEYRFNIKDIKYISFCKNKDNVKKYSSISNKKKNFYPYGFWYKDQFVIIFNKPLLINTGNIGNSLYPFNHFHFRVIHPNIFINENVSSINIKIEK